MTDPDDFYSFVDPDSNYFDGLFDSLATSQQSNYVSVSEYNTAMSNSDSISFMAYNIRSFKANSNTFFPIFHNFNSYPDVFCLSETWFQDALTEDIPGFVSYHTVRVEGRSGGVSVFVKEYLKSRLLPNFCLSNNNIELCSVELSLNNTTVNIFGIYRPHSGTIQSFNDILSSILDDQSCRSKLCVLLGDFNINLLSDDSAINSFMHNLHSHHFLPLITKPTRFPAISNSLPTLLDQIWINDLNYKFKCNILMHDITDHLPIHMQLYVNNSSRSFDEKIKISFRCNSQAERDRFENVLMNFNWNSLVNSNVNEYLNNFISKLDELYCLCFPLKTKFVSRKQFDKPWITPQIKKLLLYKSHYFRLLQFKIITPAENNRFKNKIKSLINRSKSSFFNNYFTRNKSNVRKTWDMIKVLTSQNAGHKSIKSIFWNNREYYNDLDIANAFNQFFCTIADDLDNNLPASNIDPLSFVVHNRLSSIFLTPVMPTECSHIIGNLKVSKQGIDNIPVNIFKTNCVYFVEVLCDIINLSFSSGVFPEILKVAHTIPIFKKGEKTCINNYRPVSLLHFISKIFEKCLHSRLMHFFISNNIISDNQFGFLKQISTEDAILKLVESLYESLNAKLNCINIFIDFKKAFDTINHSILLKKMEAYGIRGSPLELIGSYLQNRKQFVKINQSFSSAGQLSRGIPQGSVLGPLLFLVFINDLPNLSNQYQTILFADDTTLSFKGENLSELVQSCNLKLDEFVRWSVANRLTINTDKTFYNITSNLSNDLSSVDISLNNDDLTHKSNITYLGVIIDEKLKFKEHINFICNKISKSIGVLNKLKNLVPFFTMKNLYYTLVYPYLNYCNLIWGGTFSSHLHPLFVLQKRVIRIVNNKSFLHHTNDLFLNSSILKLEDIHKFNLAAYMFKSDNFENYTSSHTYSTRSSNLLNPHYQRLSVTQHSLSYSGPSLWNTLPSTVKSSCSLLSFKSKLKHHLIQSYIS